MRNIMSAEAPRILEDIVHAHNLPAMFREDTANYHVTCGHHTDVRIIISGFDDDRRRVHFSACKGYRPTTHHTRFIRTDKDGECFTFAGVTYHAWMFETGEERAAIASDSTPTTASSTPLCPTCARRSGPACADRLCSNMHWSCPACHTATTWTPDNHPIQKTRRRTMRLTINNLTPEHPDPEDEAYWDFMGESLDRRRYDGDTRRTGGM